MHANPDSHQVYLSPQFIPICFNLFLVCAITWYMLLLLTFYFPESSSSRQLNLNTVPFSYRLLTTNEPSTNLHSRLQKTQVSSSVPITKSAPNLIIMFQNLQTAQTQEPLTTFNPQDYSITYIYVHCTISFTVECLNCIRTQHNLYRCILCNMLLDITPTYPAIYSRLHQCSTLKFMPSLYNEISVWLKTQNCINSSKYFWYFVFPNYGLFWQKCIVKLNYVYIINIFSCD
jgi:hypothetical protein